MISWLKSFFTDKRAAIKAAYIGGFFAIVAALISSARGCQANINGDNIGGNKVVNESR